MKLRNINQAVTLAKRYVKDTEKEHCIGIYVNADAQVKGVEVISIGSAVSTVVEPREVFRPAVFFNATGIVLLHNHPSGQLKPSHQDIDTYELLKQAGDILHIDLMDSIIFTTGETYYSIKLGKKFKSVST